MANQIATWLNKGYAEKLVKAATGYWSKSRNHVMWAVQQKDELQAEEPVLGLLAWERLTQRLDSEPLDLYRKRVQHALVNTIDAGEIATISPRVFRPCLSVPCQTKTASLFCAAIMLLESCFNLWSRG